MACHPPLLALLMGRYSPTFSLRLYCGEPATFPPGHSHPHRAPPHVPRAPLVLSAVILLRACHPPLLALLMGRYSPTFSLRLYCGEPATFPPGHSHPPRAPPHVPRAPLVLSAVILLRACHPPLLALLMGRYSPTFSL